MHIAALNGHPETAMVTFVITGMLYVNSIPLRFCLRKGCPYLCPTKVELAASTPPPPRVMLLLSTLSL